MLGFHWGPSVYHTSDYFERLYRLAVRLIKKGGAYVDELSAVQFNELKGSPTEPGKESPFRNRPIEENVKIFEAMR